MTPDELRKIKKEAEEAEAQAKGEVIEKKVEEQDEEEDEFKGKSEEEILFPEIEIDGFKIRPWTLGKLKRVNPCLERILGKLENKGIKLTLDNIENNLWDLYIAAIDEIITILSISLDVEEEKLEDIPIPQAIRLIFLVYKQNEDSIKNVSSLLQMTSG